MNAIADVVGLSVVALSLALFLAAMIFPFFGSLVWIDRDAKLRGKPPELVAVLAALLAWPISLLVWIALRPPPVLWGRKFE